MSSRIPVYGLGPPITQDGGHITGGRLATCEQVLRCYFVQLQNPTLTNQTQRDSVKIVIRELLPFYKKAAIRPFRKRKLKRKLFPLQHEMQSYELFQQAGEIQKRRGDNYWMRKNV